MMTEASAGRPGGRPWARGCSAGRCPGAILIRQLAGGRAPACPARGWLRPPSFRPAGGLPRHSSVRCSVVGSAAPLRLLVIPACASHTQKARVPVLGLRSSSLRSARSLLPPILRRKGIVATPFDRLRTPLPLPPPFDPSTRCARSGHCSGLCSRPCASGRPPASAGPAPAAVRRRGWLSHQFGRRCLSREKHRS